MDQSQYVSVPSGLLPSLLGDIRLYRIKNARILAEVREIDSYLTDGDSDSEDDEMPPTLAQKEFDNSILRMGRLLVQAAKANPIEGTSEIPRITMRLTRLTPFASLEDSDGSDPRIAETVDLLRAMGIDVELGERNSDGIMARLPVPSAAPVPSRSFQPTRRVVLDLSSLIALISDLTHFALPATAEEIYTRFIHPQEYRDWKESRIEHKKPQDKVPKFSPERTIEDLPKVYVKQARALTRQLLQETSRGMIQEIHDQLVQVTDGDLSSVEFWTTPEARSRCLLIVNKIGGANEKRRVAALLNHGEDLQDGIQSYWKGSRYLSQYIPLLPLKYFPSSSEPTWMSGQDTYNKHKLSPFSRILKQTCEHILAQEVIPDPRTIDGTDHAQDQQEDGDWEIQRAVVTKANPRLTAHTVQSMLWGAELGWTVLTGNKSSVKAILREIRAASLSGRLKEEDVNLCAATNTGQEGEEKAAIWVVDPRSLAEGMSSLPSTE